MDKTKPDKLCEQVQTLQPEKSGADLPNSSVPTITPQIAAALAEESRVIQADFHKRLLKMWDIPWHERFARCK